MGSFFSKKKSFEKELADLEDKILNYEDYISKTRLMQHKIFSKIIIYGIILEVILFIWIYFKTKSMRVQQEKLFNYSLLLLFPLTVFIFTRLFNTLYKQIIHRNEKKLDSLKVKLQSRIDERKKETDYENTQKIIDKYDKLIKKKKENDSPNTQSPKRTNNNNNNNNMNGSPTMQSSPKRTSLQSQLHQQGIRHRQYQPSGPQSPQSPQPQQQQPLPQSPQQSPNGRVNNTNNNFVNSRPINYPAQSQQQQPQRQQTPWKPNWLDKIVDYIISDGPKYGSPLICQKCHNHNGYVPTNEISTIQFRCRFCHTFNQRGENLDQKQEELHNESLDNNNNNESDNDNHDNKSNGSNNKAKKESINEIDSDSESKGSSATAKQITEKQPTTKTKKAIVVDSDANQIKN